MKNTSYSCSAAAQCAPSMAECGTATSRPGRLQHSFEPLLKQRGISKPCKAKASTKLAHSIIQRLDLEPPCAVRAIFAPQPSSMVLTRKALLEIICREPGDFNYVRHCRTIIVTEPANLQARRLGNTLHIPDEALPLGSYPRICRVIATFSFGSMLITTHEGTCLLVPGIYTRNHSLVVENGMTYPS